jgi:hypothetical protein
MELLLWRIIRPVNVHPERTGQKSRGGTQCAVKIPMQPLEKDIPDDGGDALAVHQVGIQDQVTFRGSGALASDSGMKRLGKFERFSGL